MKKDLLLSDADEGLTKQLHIYAFLSLSLSPCHSILQFSKQPVLDAYTAFTNNFDHAKELITKASQKLAFIKFLEVRVHGKAKREKKNNSLPK